MLARIVIFALALPLLACSRSSKAPPSNRCKALDSRELAKSTTATPTSSQQTVIEGISLVRQRADFSGEAAVEMGARQKGQTVDQNRAFELAELDPAFGRGMYATDLTRVVEKLGFDPGPVWYSATEHEAAGPFADLRADLAANIPSIVCLKDDEAPKTNEEFRLIVGFDPEKDEVLYQDSNRDDGAYRRMPRQTFIDQWTRPHEQGGQMVVRVRLSPKAQTLPDIPKSISKGFSVADYAQHVIELKKQIGKKYTVVVEPPFVVIGNDTPDAVRASAEQYVRRTAELLEKDFFNKRPDRILDVWLFIDHDSYAAQTQTLLGRKPTTPYGYYTSENNALVMNISTGAGTLVHEMVHPYIEANVPNCPTWINEGIASLYERPGEENGHLRGYPNWRLPSLQKAIREKKLPPFQELASLSSDEFYRGAYSTNYAQSRYIFYYLQQKDLLVTFYKLFETNIGKDPTGYDTLTRVLGEKDMKDFQRRWEEFVLELVES